ncbi:hypothetical protein GmHk_08G021825 [Glycine max]|nr:hypothetical protein GmHk_08G021825 [Glycine max]
MNEDREDESVVVENIDCSYVFPTYEDIFYDNEVRHINQKEKKDLVFLKKIGCYKSEKYITCNKALVQTVINTKKCGYPFKLRVSPKRLRVNDQPNIHAYVGQQLTEDENIILGEMTKSIVKPMNIFFTLKEHNVNHCITMTQVYNVKYAYRFSIRDAKTCTEK